MDMSYEVSTADAPNPVPETPPEPKQLDMVDWIYEQEAMAAAATRDKLGLLTEGELANAIGVEESTLQVWRSRGEGPDFTKLGKSVFYTMDALDEWVMERRQSPKKPATAQAAA
jgi:hypothetical protein